MHLSGTVALLLLLLRCFHGRVDRCRDTLRVVGLLYRLLLTSWPLGGCCRCWDAGQLLAEVIGERFGFSVKASLLILARIHLAHLLFRQRVATVGSVLDVLFQ